MTFDTGVLIGLERRHQRASRLVRRLRETGQRLVVPMVVIAEWWRGRSDIRDEILRSVTIEPATVALMKMAGEALAAVPTATPIDALVMASAATRNDVVLTGDFQDMTRLQAHFPGVRVLSL